MPARLIAVCECGQPMTAVTSPRCASCNASRTYAIVAAPARASVPPGANAARSSARTGTISMRRASSAACRSTYLRMTKSSPTNTGSMSLPTNRAAALTAISGPIPLGSPIATAMRVAMLASKRKRDESIEARAVADDDTLDEPQRAVRILADGVDILACREEVHASVAHDARHQKRTFGPHHMTLFGDDRRTADDVAVALTLVDVGLAQRRDAVLQHRLRVGVNDAGLEPVPVIFRGGDLIEAALEEKFRPRLHTVVIDAARVLRVERGQALRETAVGHAQSPIKARYSFQKPRTDASVARESWLSMPSPPISSTACASAACAIPRCTNPPTAPSSIDT